MLFYTQMQYPYKNNHAHRSPSECLARYSCFIINFSDSKSTLYQLWCTLGACTSTCEVLTVSCVVIAIWARHLNRTLHRHINQNCAIKYCFTICCENDISSLFISPAHTTVWASAWWVSPTKRETRESNIKIMISVALMLLLKGPWPIHRKVRLRATLSERYLLPKREHYYKSSLRRELQRKNVITDKCTSRPLSCF